jgi:exodeoxyribonuclease III
MTRFATWNVNSLNARLDRVQQWIADIEPDILCMQETKLADEAFPAMAFEALGYESFHHGEGRWNGVGILSRVGLADVSTGFDDGLEPDAEARVMTARCDGVSIVNVYVPNGRSVDHEQYQYKLSWLARLEDHVDAVRKQSEAVILAGDFNIAPTDIDVYDPAKFAGATHVSPAERDVIVRLQEKGWHDVLRSCYPDIDRVFSWWDYRAGDFHEGRGMRIDHVLASPAVASRVEWCIIDRNARKGQQPSDHAPVVVDLAD